MRSLTARGLIGVKLVVSDTHRRLVDALGAALPGAAWQFTGLTYHRVDGADLRRAAGVLAVPGALTGGSWHDSYLYFCNPRTRPTGHDRTACDRDLPQT
jgi:hypothetical protein